MVYPTGESTSTSIIYTGRIPEELPARTLPGSEMAFLKQAFIRMMYHELVERTVKPQHGEQEHDTRT
jgi:hypothetical protein